MKTLTIRNVPDEVHAALRMRAAAHGRSMEEEVRATLSHAIGAARSPVDAAVAIDELRALIRAANGGRLPSGAVDELIAQRRAEAARELADGADRAAKRSQRGPR